ncbi:hypothetical protein H6G72_29570, partial [Planktothricoides sp. FACHB-1370]|nr:hypothetical protein [Planktothricoides raciborskii FACHB-1370]
MSDRKKNTQNQTDRMSLNRLQVVVIGGGAAGFFGANACTQANPKANV